MSTEGSTDVQVQVKEGEKNPCFVCMGVCFLLIVLLVVFAAFIVHYVRPNLSMKGTAEAELKCKAALELTACNTETEQYFFYHDSDKQVCLVRWQLDPSCLEGKNRFASASECRERCVGNSSEEGARQNPSPECMEPVRAAPCKNEEIKRRDHPYFFEGGNCTLQMGPKCLYGPNRFVSAQECHEFCLNTEEPACRVPRFQGACRISEKRFVYYYDSSMKACVSWRTPCLAGPNRHESLAACAETCGRNIFKTLMLVG